jgi:hypothetical protein
VNSIALSNLVSQYAPVGETLISSTSISSLTDEQALSEISKFWGIPASDFELIKRYEIRNSLPVFSPSQGGVSSAHVKAQIFRAGDYLTAGSQNGALLSGRLAALESLAN